ncbi:MAG: CUAEP/CCAEP-tail radical SAM protein [Pseudomonadota bacterium]|nr:CUAEP/CCAEP-tail radical SAM protein [Pseudomonadota bacterium]
MVKFPNVVLISTYDLGRQPYSIALASALVGRKGAKVCCNDLAVEDLASENISNADLIALHLPMHTATRLAVEVLPRIRELNQCATIVCYGNYAVMNKPYLISMGVDVVLGGEAETALADLCSAPMVVKQSKAANSIYPQRQRYVLPDRTGLGELSRYSHLILPSGVPKVAGYTESTRGCKHVCKHCPVVPVYEGRFFAVDRDLVMQDIEQQIEMGAKHITFGDPDFFNGPKHGIRVVEMLSKRHPGLTYDVTIKVEHLLGYAELLPILRETGCLFVTTAVESFDDQILKILDKGHTRADFAEAVEICSKLNLNLVPTFVAFTPWTTPKTYLEFLREIVHFDLISRVPVVQYSLRLLVPRGSLMLDQDAFREFVGAYDPDALSYTWNYQSSSVGPFEAEVGRAVEVFVEAGLPAVDAFSELWRLVHHENEIQAPRLPSPTSLSLPSMSEPWYCCSEPTKAQLSRL